MNEENQNLRQKFQDDIEKAAVIIVKIKEELSKKIVGQIDLIESLLIGLF
jgi:hypothetical protein